jgi:hypothetical protein
MPQPPVFEMSEKSCLSHAVMVKTNGGSAPGLMYQLTQRQDYLKYTSAPRGQHNPAVPLSYSVVEDTGGIKAKEETTIQQNTCPPTPHQP